MRAAISALPHEVPRLAVTAVVSDQDFATKLDKAIARIANAEKKTINGDVVVTETKPEPEPQPSLPIPAPLYRIYDKRAGPGNLHRTIGGVSA